MLNFIVAIAFLTIFVVCYALILRPMLRGIPQFADFYAEADGFWSKVWAYCGQSATIAWSYIVGGVGLAFSLLDKIGPMIGDPELNLQQKVVDVLKDHPTVAAWALVAFSVITIATRLRGIMRS